MTFDDLWQTVMEQNPGMTPERSDTLFKAVKLGYDQGVKEERNRQASLQKLAEEWRRQGRDDKSIFEQIFGKGFQSK